MRINQKKKKKSLNPIFTILILTLFIMLLSLIFSLLGIDGHKSTIVNGSLESSLTTVKNIFSVNGLRFLLGNIVNSFTKFEPLAYLVLSLIGISIGSASGLFQKLFSPLKKIRLNILTFIVLFVAIISNMIGDYSYMLLIPLVGVMYQYAGKNPMLGIMTVFLGISIGYGANLIFTYDDYALGMLTQVAATASVDQDYVFHLLSTSIIAPISTVILTFIGTIIVTKFLAPKLPKKVQLEEVVEYHDSKMASRLSGLLFIILLLAISYMIIPGLPGSGALLDHNETEYIAMLFSPNAPFRTGVVLLIMIIFMLCSFVYGLLSGNLKSTEDCGLGLSKEFKNIGYLFVLLFFTSNMLAILNWTNLGSVITTRLVDFISLIPMSGMPLILSVFVIIIIASILIPGTVEKWTLLSPIVIPLFMRSNITPDFTQFIFKAADGIGKSISLFFVYFIIMVGFLQKYNAEGKEEITLMGTLKLLAPSILLFTIVWILIIIGWYLVGLPIGMNAMPTL
ncbi:MAG: AbgT family transporter [Firmicutes bacterium]|nr:AbgT family transporter [Bacillota bacterium]